MSASAKRRLHLWYGIFLAVFTVVVGILFISQAADIYYGEDGYSRELVVERCNAIAAPFWIWVVAVIAGGVLWMVFPAEGKKLKRIPDSREDVERITSLAAEGCDDPKYVEAANAVKREKKIRGTVWICCMTVCLVCAGVAAYFVFNLSAYPSDANEAILGLVRSVLPCIAVAFAACLGATIFDGISAKKVLPYAKTMLAVGGRAKNTQEKAGRLAVVLQSPVTLLAVRVAIIIAAVIMIIFGVRNGGMNDVLVKAINICTECIGLG